MARLLDREPVLRVGLLEGAREARLELTGGFDAGDGRPWRGPILLRPLDRAGLRVLDPGGKEIYRGEELVLSPLRPEECLFLVRDLPIGIGFHWEQGRDQAFRGEILARAHPSGGLLLINRISLEDYLESVLSSEMNPSSPFDFLLAHAVVSRSWLAAQLERSRAPEGPPPPPGITWRDRSDHELFDVCADDHCQRYQGVPAAGREAAARAVRRTRGTFLVSGGEICDARFSKACGGRSEFFSTAWEEREIPCLASVRCWEEEDRGPLETEEEARSWILGRPPSFCADPPEEVRRAILPDFDLATRDFYRWKVEYEREELEGLLLEKGGIRVGPLEDLLPVKRGPSGRISLLRIRGGGGEVLRGKELEIRRLLSPTHLYSSAFVVRKDPPGSKRPRRFVLLGAGWGHGVGFCQVGAAVMAWKGRDWKGILSHYFPGSRLERLYS